MTGFALSHDHLFSPGFFCRNKNVVNEKVIDSHYIRFRDEELMMIRKVAKDSPMNLFVMMISLVGISVDANTEGTGFIFHTCSLKNTENEKRTLLPLLIEKHEDGTSLRSYFNKTRNSVKQAYLVNHKGVVGDAMSGAELHSNVLVLSSQLHDYYTDIYDEYDFLFLIIEDVECVTLRIDYRLSERAIEFISQFDGCVAKFLSSLSNMDTPLNKVTFTMKPFHLVPRQGSNVKIDKTFLELFNEQVIQYPDRPAIKSAHEGSISYTELHNRSDSLASYITDTFGPIKVVGVMLSQSVDLIVACLATWKVGAVLVPIDPALPENRVQTMVKNAEIELVLVERSVATMNTEFGGQFCYVKEITQVKYPTRSLAKTVFPISSVAYIIFTSGSTGIPKGVQISHASFSNYLQWARACYVDSGSVLDFSLFTSISFDLTLTSIFLPLISGSSILLQGHDVRSSLYENFYGETPASIVKITPSHIDLLSSFDYKPTLVKKVIVGGELLRVSHVQFLYSINADIQIFNEYGPTETTVGCTVKEITSIEDVKNKSVGMPAWNTQIYIMDDSMQLLDMGLEGQIYIAGDGLSSGYVNSPERSSEVFLTHPFCENKKIYRTGDIGKWLKNGELAVLGRSDRQVKLNGYRIELAEIESCLLKIEGIENVFVSVVEKSISKVLTAYLKMQDHDANDGEKIDNCLREYLPEYMIPKQYIFLKTFPLTSNGKLDTNALQAITVDKTAKLNGDSTNAVEETLINIWKEVLGIDTVSLTDNFYHLGGDSIKSIQIASRMYKSNYVLDVGDILEFPTILLQAKKAKFIDAGKVDLNQTTTEEFALSPIQSEFLNCGFQYPHHYNHSLSLRFDYEVSQADVLSVFQKLIAVHDTLRLQFVKIGSKWMQRYSGFAEPKISSWDLRNVKEPFPVFMATVNRLHQSIHLESAPLMQVGLFYFNNECRLVLILHHLIVDSVSWRILIEDLDILFGQVKAHAPMEVQPPTMSYQAWVRKLNEYIQSNTFHSQIPFWKQTISNTRNVVPQRHAGLLSFRDKRCIQLHLSSEDTTKLLTKANEAFNTRINDLLLLALSLAMSDRFGCNEVPLYLESHGRHGLVDSNNITRTVGWFTSCYPVVIPLRISDGIDKQIVSVKEYLRRIPDNGIGYGLMKYSSTDQGITDNTPQVCFNYLGQFDQNIRTLSFSVERAFDGEHINRDEKMEPKIQINGMVVDSVLRFEVVFNSVLFSEVLVRTLASSFQSSLVEVINFCVSCTHREKTSSDFLYKELTMQDLDNLFVD
jgi:iturin family lipopeptide synthetase C